MEKIGFTQKFAERLRESMISAGFHSQRSTSGVDIHKLAEITGYSPQICRKYLRGQAIPEPTKLSDIAKTLCVSPGWLLFGDSQERDQGTINTITISKKSLHYMFMQAYPLYHAERSEEDISDFLLDLATNIGQINGNEEQSQKIIDLALSSIRHFGTYK